jgi:tellurite resistance protein
MFSKEFFDAYGEVLHAVAMADGTVQAEEIDHMIDVIKEVLKPVEGSSVYGFRSLWYMDSVVVPDPSQVIQKFVAYCSAASIRFTQAQAEALTNCLLELAKAYGKVEAEEKRVVERFAQALQPLMA